MSEPKTREEIVRWVDEQLASIERGMTEVNVGQASVTVVLRRGQEPFLTAERVHKDYVFDSGLMSDCARNVECAERKYGANSEEATDALRELHRARAAR